MNIVGFLIARLKEPSTWAGIGAILAGVGIALKPELWWQCEVCRTRAVAKRATVVVDPHVNPVLLEQAETAEIEVQLRGSEEPVGTEKADMSTHMRHILAE